MLFKHGLYVPKNLREIHEKTREIGFDMASGPEIGTLLRTLACTKPHGRLLELGTGTGISTAWILDGMQTGASLITIDNNQDLLAIAQGFLGTDPRVEFLCTDASQWLHAYDGEKFDLVFADAWPGKYNDLDLLLNLLGQGGIYIIDDMEEQPNWPEGHGEHVQRLINELAARQDLQCTRLNIGTGFILAAKM